MPTILLILLVGLKMTAAPGAGAAEAVEVVAPGSTLEKLWGEGSFTEGGALAADGSILFSDIGNRIMRFNPEAGSVTVFRDPSGRANGLIFDAQGRLIAAEGANSGGGRRVSITDREGTVRTLADRYKGEDSTVRTTSPSTAGGGFTFPIPAMLAPSPATSILRPFSGSIPTVRFSASRRRPPSPTAWSSALRAPLSTFRTTVPRGAR